MPDSCSLSLSLPLHSALSHLRSTHGRKPRSPFAASEASLTVNANLLVHREAISFFSLSFLSLSLCVVLSLHSFIRPSFFYVALSLFPCPSTSLSPVSAQIFRGRRNRSLPPSLLPVRKNQPRLPLPFDGIGLPPTPPERKNRKRGRCSESTSE